MNPLDWKRQHQVAGIAFCAVGAIAGIFLAWMDSPFRQLSSHSVSGEWANATNVFLLWLSHVGLYWPWPLMGKGGDHQSNGTLGLETRKQVAADDDLPSRRGGDAADAYRQAQIAKVEKAVPYSTYLERFTATILRQVATAG